MAARKLASGESPRCGDAASTSAAIAAIVNILFVEPFIGNASSGFQCRKRKSSCRGSSVRIVSSIQPSKRYPIPRTMRR